MPKVFTSGKQKIGEIGENIACKFLVKHGFLIKDRNFTEKWGEIDIIAEKGNKLYFVEVKSVSSADVNTLADKRETATCKTSDSEYRPEDNMHPWKMKRLSRTIQTYLLFKKVPDDKEWQVDLLVVYLDLKNKKAKVETIKDIIL